MKKFCTFYIVRHGETDWNVEGIIQGHTDIPLNKIGENQAKILGEKLSNINFSDVYSSDLQRAFKTAEIIINNKLKVIPTESLEERYFGKYEGKHFSYLAKDEVIAKKDSDLKGEVESVQSVVDRSVGFMKKIAVLNLGKKVLLVTHGGVMRYLLIHLGFGTKETLRVGAVGNMAYAKVECDGFNFRVVETFGIRKIE